MRPPALNSSIGCVDTPFSTGLKTWTSPLEHSVIIHVRARLEFPEFSATRLASGPPNLTALCLVLHQTLVLCLGGAGNAFGGIPTHHRQQLEAIGWLVLPSALYCAGRHYFWQNDHFALPITLQLFLEIFPDSFLPLSSPPYTCMEG